MQSSIDSMIGPLFLLDFVNLVNQFSLTKHKNSTKWRYREIKKLRKGRERKRERDKTKPHFNFNSLAVNKLFRIHHVCVCVLKLIYQTEYLNIWIVEYLNIWIKQKETPRTHQRDRKLGKWSDQHMVWEPRLSLYFFLFLPFFFLARVGGSVLNARSSK